MEQDTNLEIKTGPDKIETLQKNKKKRRWYIREWIKVIQRAFLLTAELLRKIHEIEKKFHR